ncbi:MAG: hypothetical protein J0G30_11490 [Actinomycetales bacterium]|nr:hypothetical protein [Actinomycetales bacterium]
MVTRRTVLTAVALAVLIPGAAAASLSIDALGYLGSRPTAVTEVPRDETARLGEFSVHLTDLQIARAGTPAAEDRAVPPGADLLVADFRVDPGATLADGLPYCEIDLVGEGPDGPATWSGSGYVDADYRVPDGLATSCERGGGSAYDLEVLFLLPTGVAETASFQISARDLLPQAIRMPIG